MYLVSVCLSVFSMYELAIAGPKTGYWQTLSLMTVIVVSNYDTFDSYAHEILLDCEFFTAENLMCQNCSLA